MSEEKKPMREWWLITWKMDCYDAAISDKKVNDDDIHVIERSFHDAEVARLQGEIAGLKAEFPNNAIQNSLNKTCVELAHYKALCEELGAALKAADADIDNGSWYDAQVTIAKALKKLEGSK